MVCKFLHSQNVEQTSYELNAIKSIQLQIKRKRFYVWMFEWMILHSVLCIISNRDGMLEWKAPGYLEI